MTSAKCQNDVGTAQDSVVTTQFVITPQLVINFLITNCGACHHAICNNSAFCNKLFKLGLSQDLLFVALWFILRGDLFYVLTCVILFLCVFSPFSIVITSLGEERANLSAFRTFVRFPLVWFCLFLLPLGVWEGLRFVIVALLNFSLTNFFFAKYMYLYIPNN